MYYSELSPAEQSRLAKNAELACRVSLKQIGLKLKNALYGTPRFTEWTAVLTYLDPEVEAHAEHGFAPDGPPHALILFAYNSLDYFGASKSAKEVIATLPEALNYELLRLGMTKHLARHIDSTTAQNAQ
jgi:hypothetical protein